MNLLMNRHVTEVRERFAAERARERLLASVHSLVVFQVGFCDERLATVTAFEVEFTPMNLLVFTYGGSERKRLVAERAWESCLFRRAGHFGFRMGFCK